MKIIIIVDGSNFYHRLKELELKNLLNFDYQQFAQFLNRSGGSIIERNYYIGAVREESGNPKSSELMKNQRILTGNLKKHGWNIKFGHMLKSEKYHEKGVDVQMAVDLLVGAYEDKYDLAILVSSDTDLIPAIIKVRSMKKQVEYIGFSHKPSYGLITNSDIRRLLIREDLEKFIL